MKPSKKETYIVFFLLWCQQIVLQSWLSKPIARVFMDKPKQIQAFGLLTEQNGACKEVVKHSPSLCKVRANEKASQLSLARFHLPFVRSFYLIFSLLYRTIDSFYCLSCAFFHRNDGKYLKQSCSLFSAISNSHDTIINVNNIL